MTKNRPKKNPVRFPGAFPAQAKKTHFKVGHQTIHSTQVRLSWRYQSDYKRKPKWWRQWDHGQIWLTSGWIMELIENIHIWNDPKFSYWGSLPPPSIFGFPMLSEIHPHLQGLLDGFHLAIYMQKVVVHPGEFRKKIINLHHSKQTWWHIAANLTF